MQELAERVLRAQEAERQRIARELHDETGQTLTLLLIRLGLIAAQAPSPELQTQLVEVRGLVVSALDQVRRLALDLRPSTLDQLGLLPALRSLVCRYVASTHIDVTLTAPREDIQLAPERAIMVYRIAQEALTNSAKHSGAQHIMLAVVVRDGELRLEICDDGAGFDMATLAARQQCLTTSGTGMGLFGMEERARLAGGMLCLQSAPGQGTCVGVVVPIETEISLDSVSSG